MSATKSLHYQLACKVAQWIRRRENAEKWRTPYQLSAVELVCAGCENPDVYATNGCDSAVIEVKTSHSDFLNDQKKLSRRDKGFAMGNYRYYLCPEGIISEDELPEGWGLLYEKDGRIHKVVPALEHRDANMRWDVMLLSSILRREGLLNKVYNYRQKQD